MLKMEKLIIEINKQQIPVLISRKKIKNTYIRVSDKQEILVNTNRTVSIEQITKLIEKHQEKILYTINSKRVDETKVVYLGKIYELIINTSNKYDYKIENDKIIIDVSEKTIKNPVDYFYKSEATAILPSRFIHCVNEFKKKYSITTPNLFIRKMKSRYGTCYYKKNQIILNQNIVRMPIERIDYVIYHELSHLIVSNHSKQFYTVLKSMVPAHEEIRKNLNKL